MQLSYNLVYTVCVLLSFCHGKKTVMKPYKNDMEMAVKMLLSDKFLIVSRAVYNQPNHPRCVCSRLTSVSGLKYHHNLTYTDVDMKVQPAPAKRVYRDTFYQVKQQDSALLFLVNAYIGNQKEDNKISGVFKVFYANKECFVTGTIQSGNPSCLLWRRPHAREKHRRLCRAAFKNNCRKHGRYVFVFTKDACLKKFTKQSSPLGQVVN
uniref:Putative group viii salivary lipocalin n=1 Tax=Rhipicephalus pulchellus TaxID=72859 RepID=L7M9W3_RHIPC